MLKLYPVTSTGGTGTRGKEIWWRQGWHREMWKRNLVTSGGRIVTHGRKSIRLSHHLLSCHLFFIRCRVVFPKLLPCRLPFNGLVVFYCRFFCGFCFANNFSRVPHSNDQLETTTTPIRQQHDTVGHCWFRGANQETRGASSTTKTCLSKVKIR